MKYATKGKLVGVQGSLKAEAYKDKEGKNRKHIYVRADRIELLGSREKERETNSDAAETTEVQDFIPPQVPTTRPKKKARTAGGD